MRCHTSSFLESLLVLGMMATALEQDQTGYTTGKATLTC